MGGFTMKAQTYVILAIIFTIIISVFAVLNVGVVEVNYLFWSGESPLIFVILFSVLLGGILTTAVGTSKYVKLKRTNKEQQAQIDLLQKELEELSPEVEEVLEAPVEIAEVVAEESEQQ